MNPLELSQKMSEILRHNPTNIEIDQEGWISVHLLADVIGVRVEDILKVVDKQKKPRFELDSSKNYIRAFYGHSDSNINIQYPSAIPPKFLFHGTSKELYKNKISMEGIKKMSRQFVHMTDDILETKRVASRHTEENKILILTIIAKKMYEDGYVFYNPSGNIWLTEIVPPEYLQENN